MTEQAAQSEDTPRRSPVRMVAVGDRVVPDPPSSRPQTTSGMTTTTATQPSPEFAKEVITRTAWKAAVMGTLSVLTAVLAVRLIVLVGVGGGIGLTFIALQQPDQWRLGALAIYGVLVMVPVVWLAGRR